MEQSWTLAIFPSMGRLQRAAAGKKDVWNALLPDGDSRRSADNIIRGQGSMTSLPFIFAVMATIFNPDTMIAGGGVMEMADFPKGEFEHEVAKATGKDVMEYGFDYVYSEPFSGKGVIGAAIFARQRLEKGKK